MIRKPTIAALLLMTSCQQQEPQPSSEPAAESSAPAIPPAVPSLEGEWRVTMITGDPNAATLGMTAAFGSGMAKLATGCLTRAWTYSQTRNSVTFTASPGGSANCGRSPGAKEEEAYAALDGANIAVFVDEGRRADLSGTGATLTLQRR